MRKPFEIQLGVCTIQIYPTDHYLVTIFPEGGTVIFACPHQDNPAEVCKAYDLGYEGDVWVMTLDHELALTWLAQQEGQPYSHSLHYLAGLENLSAEEDAAEQDRAWNYQRTLDKHKIRPWFRRELLGS